MSNKQAKPARLHADQKNTGQQSTDQKNAIQSPASLDNNVLAYAKKKALAQHRESTGYHFVGQRSWLSAGAGLATVVLAVMLLPSWQSQQTPLNNPSNMATAQHAISAKKITRASDKNRIIAEPAPMAAAPQIDQEIDQEMNQGSPLDIMPAMAQQMLPETALAMAEEVKAPAHALVEQKHTKVSRDQWDYYSLDSKSSKPKIKKAFNIKKYRTELKKLAELSIQDKAKAQRLYQQLRAKEPGLPNTLDKAQAQLKKGLLKK